jgi:hypothetical protein
MALLDKDISSYDEEAKKRQTNGGILSCKAFLFEMFIFLLGWFTCTTSLNSAYVAMY